MAKGFECIASWQSEDGSDSHEMVRFAQSENEVFRFVMHHMDELATIVIKPVVGR